MIFYRVKEAECTGPAKFKGSIDYGPFNSGQELVNMFGRGRLDNMTILKFDIPKLSSWDDGHLIASLDCDVDVTIIEIQGKELEGEDIPKYDAKTTAYLSALKQM